LLRERVQDAADAASFAGAVLDARAMDNIVVLNSGMAATLSVIVGLKGARAAVERARADAAIACSLGAKWACAYKRTYQDEEQRLTDQIASVEPRIRRALEEAQRSAIALRDLAQISATQVAASVVEQAYAPTINGTALACGSLPIEDDPSDILCQRAADLAADPARLKALTLLAGPFAYAAEDAPAGARAAAGSHCQDGQPRAQRLSSPAGSAGFQLLAVILTNDYLERVKKRLDYGRLPVGARGPSHKPGSTPQVVSKSWLPKGFDTFRKEYRQTGLAQAEFFFSGAASEAVWKLGWSARLRRFGAALGAATGASGPPHTRAGATAQVLVKRACEEQVGTERCTDAGALAALITER